MEMIKAAPEQLTLEQIIERAIPLQGLCNIKRARALWLREETKKRIEQWVIDKDKRKWEILQKNENY